MNQGTIDSCNNPPDGRRIRIVKNQSGEENLQVVAENGKWITFYSAIDIRRELRLFFDNTPIPEDHLIVLFGLGLGYHLKEMARRTDQPIIVVERDEKIVKAALATEGVEDVLDNARVFQVFGKSAERAIDEISRIQLHEGLRNLCLVTHPPSVRAFPRSSRLTPKLSSKPCSG